MKMIIDGVVSKGRRSSIQSYVQMITMSQRLWIIDESIDESVFRMKIEYRYPNFIQDQMMAISVFVCMVSKLVDHSMWIVIEKLV